MSNTRAFFSSQAHPEMEWVESLRLGIQRNGLAKDSCAPYREFFFRENEKVSQENRIYAVETAVICAI